MLINSRQEFYDAMLLHIAVIQADV